MDTLLDNIRNPTVRTLMTNLDSEYWVSYFSNLTDQDILNEGLLKNSSDLQDFLNPFIKMGDPTEDYNPYYDFVRNLLWDYDKDKLAIYAPHVSKEVALRVVYTVLLVFWQLISMCYMLTSKLEPKIPCYQLFNTYNLYPAGMDLKDIYFVPHYSNIRQKPTSYYWFFFKMSLTLNVCKFNTEYIHKSTDGKEREKEILQDDELWEDFTEKNHIYKKRSKYLAKAASNFTFSLCQPCMSACVIDHRGLISFRDRLYEGLSMFCQAVSLLMLIAACVIYAIVPTLRRNINGKSTLCHLIALTKTYLFVYFDTLIFLVGNNNEKLQSPLFHYIAGFIIWFSTLAAFFWLNAICFDTFFAIWKGGQSLPEESTRLKAYALFSWGIPSVIISTASLIIWNQPKQVRAFFYSRVFSSWKAGGWERGGVLIRWLWDIPVAVSLLANVIIFALTALVLYRHAIRSRILATNNRSCTNRVALDRASIYLRLFSLVGVHWLLQMYGWRNNLLYPYIQIIGNFQGAMTFILIICRKSTLTAIKKLK